MIFQAVSEVMEVCKCYWSEKSDFLVFNSDTVKLSKQSYLHCIVTIFVKVTLIRYENPAI